MLLRYHRHTLPVRRGRRIVAGPELVRSSRNFHPRCFGLAAVDRRVMENRSHRVAAAAGRSIALAAAADHTGFRMVARHRRMAVGRILRLEVGSLPADIVAAEAGIGPVGGIAAAAAAAARKGRTVRGMVMVRRFVGSVGRVMGNRRRRAGTVVDRRGSWGLTLLWWW